MDGTFRRDGNTGEAAQQALTDFASTPAGVLTLYVQDEVFDLERKAVGVAIRTAAFVREPLQAAFLITIEDLIAGLAGDAKLPAKFRHPLAGGRGSHKLQSLIHYRTLLPRHRSLPLRGESVTHVSGTMCYLCLRSLTPLDSTIYAAFSTSGFASFLRTIRTTSAILGGSTKPKPTVSACSKRNATSSFIL